MVKLAGAKPVILPTTAESNFIPTREQFVDAVNEKTRAIILCTPSNPTGSVYSLENLQMISEIVQGHDRLLVISDEVYGKCVVSIISTAQ